MSDIKYYTAAGDDGTTGLLGRGRVKKYHPRPDTYGEVDEAQAALGMARAVMQDPTATQVVLKTQRDLYHLMAELAADKDSAAQFRTISADSVTWVEEQTDFYGAKINLPKEFTISGDSISGANLDFARTVVRRAERRVVKLFDDGFIENEHLIPYLNRLSSLCFVLARYEDALSGNTRITLARDA